MLSNNPPFASIDYKEVMEEFYKKVPKALAKNISPIQTTHIEDIERLFKNADFKFVLEHEIYGSQFMVINALFTGSQNLFVDCDVYFKKDTLSISTQTLFSLFVSFKDGEGIQGYDYLFYLFRVAYMMIEAKAFVPAVVESEKGFLIVYKVLGAIPEVKQQIFALSQLAPKMLQYDGTYLSQRSTTEAILSASMSDFVASMAFEHKKQKNNPPQISASFFQAEGFLVRGFEEKNMASAVYNYFSIFDIVKSKYRYKIYIDKDEAYFLEIKVQYEKKEYLLQQSLNTLNKMEILKFISFINTYLPQLSKLIGSDSVILSQSELETFLLETSEIIGNLGIEIVLPKELKNLLRPKLSLNVSLTSKNLQSFFDLRSMLQYDWQIAIGDETLSMEEFERLVASGKELIEFKDNFVVITAEVAKNIFAEVQRKKSLNHFDVLHATLSGEAYINELLSPKEIPVPNTLKATLRAYQERGFSWNVNNLLNGFGTVLADDMGLGKTIQAICTVLYLKEQGFVQKRTVIVVPTSLLNNWEKKLQRFAPSLSYFSYYGLGRELQESDILITTYDIVRRDLSKFKKEKIDCLIIDEAQKIKNTNTEISKAVKSLKAKYKIALSGTPVENNLSELWSIFDFALPKYLKSLKEFQKYYTKDIEIKKDSYKVEKLKKIIAPFMLRRLKTDKNIAPDLPDKIITDEYSTMSKEQAALYQSVVDESFRTMEEEESTGALVLKLIISQADM